MKEADSLYPAWLDLEGVPVLLVGGGKVAYRRAVDLVSAGAIVRIVSPELDPRLEPLCQGPNPTWVPRSYQVEDLEGPRLVFALTDDPEINRRIASTARTQGIWVCSATGPAGASLFPGAALRRGALGVSITTTGKSPTFAVALRDLLAEVLNPRWQDFLDQIGEERRDSLQGTIDASDPISDQSVRIRDRFLDSVREFLLRFEEGDR